MITLELADDRHFALRCPFEEKEHIKALGEYPDVKWDNEGKRWLVHCALWVKVLDRIPHLLNPISVDVALALPIYVPNLRKTARDRQYDKAYEKAMLKQHAKMNKELKQWNSIRQPAE